VTVRPQDLRLTCQDPKRHALEDYANQRVFKNRETHPKRFSIENGSHRPCNNFELDRLRQQLERYAKVMPCFNPIRNRTSRP
jgi:hypothetical protein